MQSQELVALFFGRVIKETAVEFFVGESEAPRCDGEEARRVTLGWFMAQ